MSVPNVRNIFGPGSEAAAAPSSAGASQPSILDPREQARADQDAGTIAPFALSPDLIVGLLLHKAGLKPELVEAFMEAHVRMKGAQMRAAGSLIVSTLADLPNTYSVSRAPTQNEIAAAAGHYSTNALLEALQTKMPGRAEYWLPTYVSWLFLDGMRSQVVDAVLEMHGDLPGVAARIRTRAGVVETVWVPDPLGATPEELAKLVEFYNMHSGHAAILGETWIEEVAVLLQMVYPFEQGLAKPEANVVRVAMCGPSRIRDAQKGLPDALYIVDPKVGRMLNPVLTKMLDWFARRLFEVYMPLGKPFQPQVYIAMQLAEQFGQDREARAVFQEAWPRIVNLLADQYRKSETRVLQRALSSFEPVNGSFTARDDMYPTPEKKKDEFSYQDLRDYLPPNVLQFLADRRAFRSLCSRDDIAERTTTTGVTGCVPFAQLGELSTCLHHVGWKVGQPVSVISPAAAQMVSLHAAGARLYNETAESYAGMSMAPAAIGTDEFTKALGECTVFLTADSGAGNNTSVGQAAVRCAWAMTLDKHIVAAHTIARAGHVKRLVFGTFLPYEEMGHTYLRDNLVWGTLASHFDLEVVLSGKLHSDRVFLCGRRRESPVDVARLEHWYRSRLFWIGAIVRTANEHATLLACGGGLRFLPSQNFRFLDFVRQATSYAAACTRAVGFSLRTMPLDVKTVKLLTTSEKSNGDWLKPLTPLVAAGPVGAVANPFSVAAPTPAPARAIVSVHLPAVSADWRELRGDALAKAAAERPSEEVEQFLAKKVVEQQGLEALVGQHPTAQNIRALAAAEDVVKLLRGLANVVSK